MSFAGLSFFFFSDSPIALTIWVLVLFVVAAGILGRHPDWIRQEALGPVRVDCAAVDAG